MNSRPYIIIGGGIIGSAIAREILLRKLGDVVILEKEKEVGEHASGRNSGVIHSGINQKPGSMKARMCLEGSKRLRDYCRKQQVPMNECGTLVVANSESEELTLSQLIQMGNEIGVPELRIIDQNELSRREPAIIGTKALFSPTGAVVDSLALMRAIAKDVQALGGVYHFSSEVTAIRNLTVVTKREELEATHIINCAGLYSDKIAHMMGVGLEYEVIPFRGEYMEVKNIPVNSMVYQAPDLRYPFLSVHFTRMTDGKLLAGPNAMLAFGRESYEKQISFSETFQMMQTGNFWKLISSKEFLSLAFHNAKTSLLKSEFLKEIHKLCPAVKEENIVPYRAGIRAQMVNKKGKMVDDILVEFREHSTHVLNAVSPGMTSALAFAEYVVNQLRK